MLMSKSTGSFFLPISSYVFTINFSGTYIVGKHLHLPARHKETLVKEMTSISYFSCYGFVLIYS